MKPLGLDVYTNSSSESVKVRGAIINDFIGGEAISVIADKYSVCTKSVHRLYEFYKTGDKEAFEKSRIGEKPAPLLERPLTKAEREDLESKISSSKDPRIINRCRVILSAGDFTTKEKQELADKFGLSCPKEAPKYIDRFLEYGIEGLKPMRTGPKPKNKEEHDKTSYRYAKIGEELWNQKNRERFVTDADIAAEAGVSESTVQKELTFKGLKYPWRRSSKTAAATIHKIARDKDQRIDNLDRRGNVKVADRIVLSCKKCDHKREIFVSTLKFDKPECPVCGRSETDTSRNKTQSFVVALVGALLGVRFEEEVTPPFLKKATGRYLRFDGYHPIPKIAIEYQGGLHYGPVKLPGLENIEKAIKKHKETVQSDKLKRGACFQYSCLLIEIPEIKEPTLRLAHPAIESAFRKVGLKPPTYDELKEAFHALPQKFHTKNSDRKKANCIERILEKKSSVKLEMKRLGVSKSTIYRWRRRYLRLYFDDYLKKQPA